ncbi:hypothetical protein POM88_054261 [Heracleum sosnowskyi]|uniref:rRNA N-glycosylase n=1 Tax=Heracleum sosnowskyi TaxID=360622 RepID=A0AAD8LX87_9APIA|nr:hypothetical protein POM88_054261 [Heracleum sosnowskyi]
MTQDLTGYFLPTLDLDQATDKEDRHFQDFRASVFRIEKVDDKYQMILKSKKCHESVTKENLLQFAPFTYQGLEVEAIIYPVDFYIVGIKHGQICHLLREKNEETAEMEGFKTCLEYHGLTVVHETLGYSYPDLEKASGTKRSQIVVSRTQLIEAVLFFSTLRPRSDNSNDVGQLAFHVMCLTQMLCESLRIKPLRKFIIHNYEHDQVLGVLLLILEHGWAIASKTLLKKEVYKSKLEIYYSDNTDNSLLIGELNTLYDVLEYYSEQDLDKEDKVRDLETVCLPM